MQGYAVFGNPIAHSKSPAIHRLFAQQTGRDLDYQAQCIDLDSFASAVRTFFSQGGSGLNITVPFKLEAHALAEKLTSRANQAGAVNTLWQQDGLLWGDNTDGVGLCRDISVNLDWPIQRAKIVVLGAGGAARGIIAPLLQQRPTQIIIANRSIEKAQDLVRRFGKDAQLVDCRLQAFAYSDLQTQTTQFDLLINATSASLHDVQLPIEPALVNGVRCYDMMYARQPTAFLQWAASSGARSIADGLGMLVEQAAESFAIWQGVHPETKSIIAQLRQAL